ncbi:MAG: hypothetical protein AAB556_01210 [Patescibacteria group bacterium]
MDPESKQILREQLELLKKINKHFTYQRAWSVIKNIIVIGLIVFSAFQLQPYLDSILGALNLQELLKSGGL